MFSGQLIGNFTYSCVFLSNIEYAEFWADFFNAFNDDGPMDHSSQPLTEEKKFCLINEAATKASCSVGQEYYLLNFLRQSVQIVFCKLNSVTWLHHIHSNGDI